MIEVFIILILAIVFRITIESLAGQFPFLKEWFTVSNWIIAGVASALLIVVIIVIIRKIKK